MKELLRKFSFLLCFVALLSLMVAPVFADPTKSDHPWDDSSPGNNTGGFVTGGDPAGGGGGDQAMTSYNVYLGFEGLFNFLADSFAYYYRVIVLGTGKDGKVVKPDSQKLTAAQSKG